MLITRSIPPGPNYPGLLAHDLGNGREIVVIGSGETAERVLREAVERRGGMADRWCILRTSGGRTLPLARSLAASGYRVWTPSEVINRRRPRSTATIDIEAPIMPTFVFVRSDRLLDLVTTLALPISPHPPFSIFHHGERIPLISDREIAGLQAEEARLAKVRERKLAGFKRRERHDVEAGTEIKLPDDAFVGLTGVVEYGDGKHAVVSFGGSLRLKIETWRLACDRVEAASSLEDTAARAA